MKRTKWWFTFGQAPRVSNYVIIEGSFSEARVKMMRRFGAKWCGQYPTAEEAGVEKYHLKNFDDQVDDAFLKKLVEVARKYGWSGDYVEVRDFVQYCFREASKTPPTDEELEPFKENPAILSGVDSIRPSKKFT